MSPLTANPVIALDHARRTNAEDIRNAEHRRLARELRQAEKSHAEPRPPWWRRWTPRPPEPRRTGSTGPVSLPA